MPVKGNIMNVLFISPNSPFESIGGVERYITNLIGFSKQSLTFNTVILIPTSGKNFSRHESKNTRIFFDNSLFLSKDALNNHKEVSIKARVFSEKVQEIITNHSIDVICAENFHIGMPAAFNLLLNMTSQTFNIPLVLRIHSFASKELQVELMNQLMWKKISCVSKSVTGDCFHKGANIDVLSTDYLGVNRNEFQVCKDTNFNLRKSLNISKESKIILTASRIILGKKNILKQKGIINLIQAFSKLSPRFPNLHLLIAVGKPPVILNQEFKEAYQMLQGYLKLNNIGNNSSIKLFGLDEMSKVYRQSDVFVLPSENETFGQVFIEAMACGLPVIGTKVGGIPEIISDSYNGFLIPPDDSSILAQRIEKIVSDSSIQNRFVRNGLKTVDEKFNNDKQTSAFIEMLRKTTEEQKLGILQKHKFDEENPVEDNLQIFS